MLSRDEILQAVFNAIDEVNALSPQEVRLKKSGDAPLFGPKGNLDSLGLINLMVATERELEGQSGIQVNIANEGAMSRPNEVFQTINTLVDYIDGLLNKDGNTRS